MNLIYSALLAALMVVVLNFATGMELWQRVAQVSYYDLYAISAVPEIIALIWVIYRSSTTLRHPKPKLWISRGDWTALVGAGVVSAFSVSAVFAHAHTQRLDTQNIAAVYAGIFAAFFASMGWLLTNYLTYANARKAHTMNILVQMRNSSIYQDHMYNIYLHFDLKKPLTKEISQKLQDDAVSIANNPYGSPKTLDDFKRNVPVIYSITYILTSLSLSASGCTRAISTPP